MKINRINIENNEFKVRDVYGKNIYLWGKDGKCDGFIGFVMSKRNIDGINSIISGIKKVKITYEEYEERKRKDDEYMKSGEYDYALDMDNLLYTNIEYFIEQNRHDELTKEQIGSVPFHYASESDWARSYSDITVVGGNFNDTEEYYKTSEVLEVLEKWKKALEKWNDPVEKKRMIEKYERENKGK